MSLEFKPVLLDVDSGDDRGMLILHDGALLGVATKLGEIHGDLAGSWFLETVFDPAIIVPHEPFADIQALHLWLTHQRESIRR